MKCVKGSAADDYLSFDSLKEDLKGYSWSSFRADLNAGLVVALVTVPQAMAYSLVAGLPLSCGLFAAIFSALFSALFGSCRHLIIGPTNATAMLVQYGTGEILFTYYRGVSGAEKAALAFEILLQLTLLAALLQLIASLFRLGRLTQFVSHSVVVGYVAGTALAIIINQCFTFFGVPYPLQNLSLFSKGVYLLGHLSAVHLPTALLGLFGLAFLLAMRRLSPRFPSAVAMLALATLLVTLLGFSSYSGASSNLGGLLGRIEVVGDTGELQTLLPTLRLPFIRLEILNGLLPISFAIALLSTLGTSMVAKAMAASTGQRLSVNQEILGLGLANLASSLIGALPCGGSPSRSSLLYSSGGKSHFSALFSCLWVGLIVAILGGVINRIPLTALSAILMAATSRIVDRKHFLLCLKATRADSLVLIATVSSCLLFSLDVAFYIGIALSIIFYLKKAAVPYLVECTVDESGKLGFLPEERESQALIRVINVHGELFFGAADLFQSMLRSIAKDDEYVKVIILRLKNARDLDATACLSLQQFNHYLKSSGRQLLACGLTHSSWEVLCSSGTLEQIGKENLFILDPKQPRISMLRAMSRARELIAKEDPALKTVRPSTENAARQLVEEFAK